MENSKHTPGPWSINPRDIDQRRIVITHNYDELRSVPLLGGCLGVYLTHGPSKSIEAANARLIAAAPDMHSFIDSVAAKGCEENGEHGPECGECDTCRARTLLNKIG